MGVFSPASFQGNIKKNKDYFEGWYLKNVTENKQSFVVVIPGIITGKDPHAFIQIFESSKESSAYRSYPIEKFNARKKVFDITIDNNSFSEKGIILDTEVGGKKLEGELVFSDYKELPFNIFYPGILGMYSYFPFLECYHGVVSMLHKLDGRIRFGEAYYDFTGGKGYIEKDWGKSFPSSWIWIQCSSFESDTSFMLSAAKVPFLGESRKGFSGFFYHRNKTVKFGTPASSKLKLLEQKEKRIVLVVSLKDKSRIEIEVDVNGYNNLLAPGRGEMNRNIKESSDSTINIRYINRSENFSVSGINAGFEISGNPEEIF